MQLLAAVLAFLAFILAGFSWKCVVYYLVFALVSWLLIYIFISNKFELDFEIVFKVFEWVGYGAPRFLENKPFSPSENAPDEQENLHKIPEPISKRVNVLIENVSNDFVASWYREVADGDVFVEESKAALEKLSLEIYHRMTNLDSHYLTEQVILVFHAHLERFNKAVLVLKEKDPNLKLNITSSQLLHQTYESQIPTKHIALKNPSSELNYLRTVVDSLLASLLPPNIFSCDIGRFILREILAVQVVELVDLLSDSDWVNEAIIDLLSPRKSQLSDVLSKPKQNDRITSDQANKKSVGSGENSIESTARSNGKVLPEGAIFLEDQVSFIQKQVGLEEESFAEVQKNKDLTIDDNAITKKYNESLLAENNYLLSTNSSDLIPSENTEISDSLNQNSIPLERVGKDQDEEDSKTAGLSSLWGFFPSYEDKTFQTQSFEAMKQKAIERERLKNRSKRFVEFGSEVKKLGTCCTQFEVSSDLDGDLQNKFARKRSRTTSLPGELHTVSNGIDVKNEIFISQNKGLQRSVSFPTNMSSVLENDLPLDPIDRPLRSSTIHPTPVYGSPYYNISFCSSNGSFKSFSDNELDIEEAEEMDEGSDSDSSEILEDIAPLPIMKAPRKSALQREAETDNFEDDSNWEESLDKGTRQRKLGIAKRRELIKDSFEGNTGTVGSTEDSNLGKNGFDGFHDNRYRSNGSKDSDSSDPRSPLEMAPPKSRRHESDPSFGDSVILAGKKFISSIKSPVKKFGFSSGSSKSTSTSSGADSLEVNVPSSIDNASFDSDLPLYRPVTKTKSDSPSSGRKLSRSQAVVDVSSESDTETYYGTPAASVKEEIVYGVTSSSSGEATDNENKGSVKIHPSQLISIPSSETALESDWEPGRNKFTLYRIEYDIRIWPSVYKAVMEDENQLEPIEEKEKTLHKKKSVPHKRAIKRRYREFMELHSRLCNGPMAIYMKDILKPNRKYNLPFGRLDKDVVEGRRRLLQYYLVSLVSKPVLRDCDELKQFLGVIGGVSFIKPSVAQIMSQSVHVPRVDKMLSRQMTKVIDSIKTALEIEGQEETDGSKSPDTVDITCPWTIVRQCSIDEQPMMDQEEVSAADCFSSFLDTLQLSTSDWRHHDSDTDVSFDDDDDDEDEDDDDDDDDLYLLGPRTAGDGSDTPNEPSIASSISKDDMLNGVLGSRPPGLCVPNTIPHSASTGSLNEKEADDFGMHWFQRDVSEAILKPVSPNTLPPSPTKETADPLHGPEKAKFSHQLRFSQKNVEKLKLAAQKAKEKKMASMENLSHAKDKVKTFSKEKKMETVEHLSHAKDKVKAFSKEKKIESLEQLSQAKDKVKTFSKEKKIETAEHLSQAKEKVKAFSKDNKFEAVEQLSHAKDKVKAFSKEKKLETIENLGQAKDKVKAFSKEKKIETLEQLSHAKDKVKAYSKEKTVESVENLHQVKDKVKAFQKKIYKPKNLLKKGNVPHFSNIGEKSEFYTFPVEKTMTRGQAAEQTEQNYNGREGKLDQPFVMSGSDDPSHYVGEVAQDVAADELQFPLAHAILNLTCEVLKGHNSWAATDRVQEGFQGIFGALFEWFVRSEIDDLFTDDCWGLYLENLIEVVWPNGRLREPTQEEKSEEEKEKTKKRAIKSLMEFFPDIFPLFVGTRIYKDCASNAVESLQNPAINRILIYILLELLLSELIPELQRNIYIEGQESLE